MHNGMTLTLMHITYNPRGAWRDFLSVSQHSARHPQGCLGFQLPPRVSRFHARFVSRDPLSPTHLGRPPRRHMASLLFHTFLLDLEDLWDHLLRRLPFWLKELDGEGDPLHEIVGLIHREHRAEDRNDICAFGNGRSGKHW